MIKTLVCKKCKRNIKVDFSKAPNDKFTIACPGCQQKYKLEKPKAEENAVTKPEAPKIDNSVKIKSIPCPKCKSELKVDFARIEKYPAVIQCRSCETKIKLNDPKAPKKMETGNMDQLAKDKAKLKIDRSKIDPKNNWAYKVYAFTKRIPYLNKLTLAIYLGYLVRSISKSLSNLSLDSITPESFLKMCAETNVVAINTFNSAVNPVLIENNISPKLTSWASNWFVKKISQRIILNVLKSKNVDMKLPYIKKYVEAVNKENAALKRIFANEYMMYLYISILLYIQYDFLTTYLSFIQLLLFEVAVVLPGFLFLRYLEFFRSAKIYALWFLVFFIEYLLNYQLSEFGSLRDAKIVAFDVFIPIFLFILIISMTGDKLERHNLQPSIFQSKIGEFIFTPRFSLGIFFIPFLGIFTYYLFTRHEITEKEYQQFNERNSYVSGKWYFLNDDSTKIYVLTIEPFESNYSEQYSSILNAEMNYFITDMEGESVGYGSYETSADYDETLELPWKFKEGLEIKSLNNDKLLINLNFSNKSMLAVKAVRNPEAFAKIIAKKEKNAIIGSMTGSYVGSFGDNEITLIIDNINQGTLVVTGSNSLSENTRLLEGTVQISVNSCTFVLNEPGDQEYDGVFEFKIYMNNPSRISGSWRSNNGQLTRDYVLYKL
jgi:hypothetical protein